MSGPADVFVADMGSLGLDPTMDNGLVLYRITLLMVLLRAHL